MAHQLWHGIAIPLVIICIISPTRLTKLWNTFEVVEEENFYMLCGWQCKLVQPLLKKYGPVLHYLTQQFHFQAHILVKLPLVKKTQEEECSQQHCELAQYRSNPNVHQEEWLEFTHTMWSYTAVRMNEL